MIVSLASIAVAVAIIFVRADFSSNAPFIPISYDNYEDIDNDSDLFSVEYLLPVEARPTPAPTALRGNLSSLEIHALVEFYNNFKGENWRWMNTSEYGNVWEVDESFPNPCLSRWQGVRCNCSTEESICSVIELSLSKYGLHGTFPSSFANFSQIRLLNLTENRIEGSFPILASKAPIKVIDLSHNKLSGTIPDTLWNLTSIEQLKLARNLFVGSLSKSVGNLVNLLLLSLGDNFLTGTLPSSLSHLKNLKILGLKDNRFHGLLSEIEWDKISKLRSINIRRNRFYGPIPSSLLSLPDLLAFNIGDNYFHGSLPLIASSSLQEYAVGHNHFNGTIPNQLFNMQFLQFLDVSFNKLTGTLPNFDVETKLQKLKFSNNSIEGYLPSGLYQQTNLHALEFNFNMIKGSISEEIGQLSKLQQLVADSNQLTGSLPLSLLSLKNLIRLVLIHNHLTGSISSKIDQLVNLRWLSLSFNHFAGQLPVTIGSLSNLTVLDLSNNHFCGSLPSTLGLLTRLETLAVEYNSFSGNVPIELSQLKRLSGIIVNANFLSGSPYAAFIGFPAIFYVTMSNNLFSGPLPLNIDWARLLFYTAFNNFFTGTLPFKRKQVKYLFYADFGGNILTGFLPKWLDEPALNYFYADNSYLGGTIPPLSSNLVELWCEGAALTGTIPVSIGNCSELQVLRLNDNRLSGTIPSELARLPKLQTLFVHQNRFHGRLDMLFPYEQESHNLVHVDFSNNQLSGLLPGGIFNSTSLQSFAAAGNCFSGSITSDVCLASNLMAISLDGLATASECRSDLKQIPDLKSFTLTHKFTGGIPSCIFALPRLQSLHVSGNELSGTLPANLVVSPSLVNISISNNKFSGPIPMSIQTHNFFNLDISYNKFSGALSPKTPPLSANSSFFAQRNRLSGIIPNSLLTAENINILDGNLFTCSLHERTLPVHDPKYSTYSCGSNETNLSFIIWLCVCFLFAVTIFVTFASTQQQLIRLYGKKQILGTETTKNFNPLLSMQVVETGDSDPHECIITTVNGDILVRSKNNDSNADKERHSTRSSFARSSLSLAMSSFSFSMPSQTQTKSPNHSATEEHTVLSKMHPAPQMEMSEFNANDRSGEMHHEEALTNVDLSNCTDVSNSPKEKTVAEIQRLYTANDTFVPSAETKLSWMAAFRMFRERSFRWQNATIDHTAPDDQQDMLSSIRMMRHVCLLLTIICIIILFPIYTGLSWYFSSYQNEYVWTVSALILSGEVAAYVMMGVFCSVMLMTWILVQRQRSHIFDAIEKDGQLTQVWFYVCFVLVDVVIMLIVNIIYVFAVEKVGPSQLIFVESSVALVKVIWNEIVVIRYFKNMKKVFFFYLLGWTDSPRRYRTTVYDFVTQCAIVVLNLVVLPIAAIAFASSNCLYNLVDPPPTVDSGFQIEVCSISVPVGTRLVCLKYINSYKEISYTPPFIYSNQCSSFIVINYASVYIYFMIIVSFVLPLSKAYLKLWIDRLPSGSLTKQRVLKVLPRALHTPQPAPNAYMVNRYLLEKRILPIRMMSYLSLMLIFGVTFPPMAVTVFIGVWIVVRFEELVLGKLLYETKALGYTWYLDRIREENIDALRYVTNPVLLWFLLSSVSLIYGYLVFDVLTDIPHSNYLQAIGPVTVVVSFPTLIFIGHIWWRTYIQPNKGTRILSMAVNRSGGRELSTTENGMEMSSL